MSTVIAFVRSAKLSLKLFRVLRFLVIFIESCSSLNLAFGEELALALSSSGTAVRKAVLSFGLPSALGMSSPAFAALSPIVKLQPSPAGD